MKNIKLTKKKKEEKEEKKKKKKAFSHISCFKSLSVSCIHVVTCKVFITLYCDITSLCICITKLWL